MNDITYNRATIENNEVKIIETKIIKQIKVYNCPNFIFDPDHYTKDSCQCYDKNAKMKKLGYRWNNKKGYWD